MSFGKYAAVAFLLCASPACATVVTFDDLTGQGTLADGYGGITWGGAWEYYDSPQGNYTPASGTERIYSKFYTPMTSFSFASGVTFNGFYVSGYDTGGSVSFDLFYQGVEVGHSSGSLTPTGTPTFLSTTYAGLVDTVQVDTGAVFYVVDNVTYNASTVPLPASAPMFGAALIGLGLIGYGMKRSKAAAA